MRHGFQLADITHCKDVIMGMIASQITSLMIVYSTIYSGADQRKHQSSTSLAFVMGIHWWPVNSPHKWPVRRKMFPFDDSSCFLWLVGLNIDWDCLMPHCIMGSRDQWEMPPFFRPQWQSLRLCTTLTTGKCLPFELCKWTVKESSLFLLKHHPW